jgi:hypothetical protein
MPDNKAIAIAKKRRTAIRHGLYSPSLPRDLIYPDRQAGIFRRSLEDAVLERHGSGGIGIREAALIHTAAEAVKLSFKNRAELRAAKKKGILTPELSLAFDNAYLRHLDIRDRKIAQLGLDRASAEEAEIAALYRIPTYHVESHPAAEVVSEAEEPHESPSGDDVGDDAGLGDDGQGAEPGAEALIQATDLLDPADVAYGDDVGVAADAESSDENPWAG